MATSRVQGIEEIFGLDAITRNELWQHLFEAIEEYMRTVDRHPVAAALPTERIRDLLSHIDFNEPQEPHDILEYVTNGLWDNQVHGSHPRQFEGSAPAPAVMGILADALASAFNPELSERGRSPFAAEVEHHVITALGRRFGYGEGRDGAFTSGGAEAHQTALLAALEHSFPGSFRHVGLYGLPARPVFYIAAEACSSLVKAAVACGLGDGALRRVPLDSGLRLDTNALREMIAADRDAGRAPFMVAATAGTETCGVVDPLHELAGLAAGERLWLHVDTGLGGAAVLLPELAAVLEGIDLADSIAGDAHRWFPVPVGAGLFLTRHGDILQRVFGQATGDTDLRAAVPGGRSIQTSRRFTGLQVFLALAVAGWEGCAEVVRYRRTMANELRRRLSDAQWAVVNETPFPVVCFVDRLGPQKGRDRYVDKLAHRVRASGEAWIDVVRLPGRGLVLRACITNDSTGPDDLAALVQSLDRARRALLA